MHMDVLSEYFTLPFTKLLHWLGFPAMCSVHSSRWVMYSTELKHQTVCAGFLSLVCSLQGAQGCSGW